MQHSRSAGGIVIGHGGRVLVTNQHGDSWSLPKGHIDPGEDARTAAQREVSEETGVTQLDFVRELGSYKRYQIGKGGVGEDRSQLKTITMFLYTADQQELKPTDINHPEAKWVPINEVAALLTHPKDREFFKSKLSQIREVIASGR